MIVCPVCKHSNDEFAIKCGVCGSFIQERVPNLDFFAIIWLLIESPMLAFKKIIIAEHKNFVLMLSLFLGIEAIFLLMWVNKSGNSFDNLFPLMLFGIVIGGVVSIPLFYTLAGSIHWIAKIINGKGSFRETYGIVGWALVPVMLSVIFVMPLALSTLGLLLFSNNPSAYEVKPVVTTVLLGLNCLMILWSILLVAVGISMAHRFLFVTSLFLTMIIVCAVSWLSFLIYSSFNI